MKPKFINYTMLQMDEYDLNTSHKQACMDLEKATQCITKALQANEQYGDTGSLKQACIDLEQATERITQTLQHEAGRNEELCVLIRQLEEKEAETRRSLTEQMEANKQLKMKIDELQKQLEEKDESLTQANQQMSGSCPVKSEPLAAAEEALICSTEESPPSSEPLVSSLVSQLKQENTADGHKDCSPPGTDQLASSTEDLQIKCIQMPLTSREKTARYRARLSADPLARARYLAKRRQREIGDLRSSVEDMRSELKTLQETVAMMQQQQPPSPEPSQREFLRIPLQLSARVRHIHRGLGEQLQWRVGPQDSFRSHHNEEVTRAITKAIKDSGESWGSEKLLRKACNRFFESLKTQNRLELAGRADDVKTKRKLNSRRDRLFKQRLLVGAELLDAEDLSYLKGADPSLMSDEESGEEDKATFVVRSPRWRSARLTRIVQCCQKALETSGRKGRKPWCLRRRVNGKFSDREAPTAADKATYVDV